MYNNETYVYTRRLLPWINKVWVKPSDGTTLSKLYLKRSLAAEPGNSSCF